MGQGVLPGLSAALLGAFARLVPSSGDQISDQSMVVLPHELWQWYNWWVDDNLTVSAGSGIPRIMLTIPNNRRAWLDWARASRTSGDNTLLGITVTSPAGYRAGAGGGLGSGKRLIELTTAGATPVEWPTKGATGEAIHVPGPVLLEPGTTVLITLGGVGTVVTVVGFNLALRYSSLMRAAVPIPT